MAVDTVQLRQDRQKIVEAMRKKQEDLIAKGSENGEDTEEFEKMESDIRALEKIIDREEKLKVFEAESLRVQDNKNGKQQTITYPIQESRSYRMASREEI